MKFIKYPSIKRLTERAIHELDKLPFDLPVFVVTEKLHGANMGIYCDGETVRIAKREGFQDECQMKNFFDSVRVAEKYSESILNLAKNWNVVKQSQGVEGKTYFIFLGELFGGGIHKGTPYSMEQDFALFNIFTVIDDTESNREYVKKLCAAYFVDEANGKLVLMPNSRERVVSIAKYIECKVLDILFKGTLEECAQFANDFESHFVCPNKVRESGVEKHGDAAVKDLCITEGVIIEPFYYTNYKGNNFTYKSKNAKFEEKYATGYKPKVSLVEKAVDNLTMDQAEMLYTLNEYLVMPRYQSVVSKMGEVTIKDFSKVLKAFVEDVLKDAKEDFAEDGKEFVQPTKDMMMLFTNEVKLYIRPILLGE